MHGKYKKSEFSGYSLYKKGEAMLKGRLLKGMVSLGIGIFLVVGIVTTSYSAEKFTIRVVTAWASVSLVRSASSS